MIISPQSTNEELYAWAQAHYDAVKFKGTYMSNIRELKINEAEHIIVTYVDKSGLRQTLDLTEMMQAVAQRAVDAHDQKRHGHQL